MNEIDVPLEQPEADRWVQVMQLMVVKAEAATLIQHLDDGRAVFATRVTAGDAVGDMELSFIVGARAPRLTVGDSVMVRVTWDDR